MNIRRYLIKVNSTPPIEDQYGNRLWKEIIRVSPSERWIFIVRVLRIHTSAKCWSLKPISNGQSFRCLLPRPRSNSQQKTSTNCNPSRECTSGFKEQLKWLCQRSKLPVDQIYNTQHGTPMWPKALSVPILPCPLRRHPRLCPLPQWLWN